MMNNLTKFKVILPDSNEYLDSIERSAKGQRLVDKICEHVDLKEKEYFSCTFENRKKNRVWLRHEDKIQSQCEGPLQFSLEVKFYPRNPETIQDPSSRYYLSLQLRKDLLFERINGSFQAVAVLGSYVAQCELGDHDPNLHGTGSSYLHPITLVANQTEDLLARICELHRTHRGMSPYEAETMFLENAGKFSMYGTHLHQAKDGEGVDMIVGISGEGISTHHGHIRVNKFAWPKILKISYKREIFFVSPRSDESQKNKKIKKLGYQLPSSDQAKRLWRLAKEHHAFFRLRKPESPTRGNLTITRHRPDASLNTNEKPQKNKDNWNKGKTLPMATIDGISEYNVKMSPTSSCYTIGDRYPTISSVDNVKKIMHVDSEASKLFLVAGRDGKLRPVVKPFHSINSQNSFDSRDFLPTASPSPYSDHSRSRQLHSNPLNTSPQQHSRNQTRNNNYSPQPPPHPHARNSPRKHRNDSKNSYEELSGDKFLVTKNVCITATSIERINQSPSRHTPTRKSENPGTSYVDHDKELAEAIRSATEMSNNLSVEKIEITTARIKDPHFA